MDMMMLYKLITTVHDPVVAIVIVIIVILAQRLKSVSFTLS